MTPAQCRAARAMIGISQDELAERSQVAKRTIASFEHETRVPYHRTVAALQAALEAEGILMSEDGGIGFSADQAIYAHISRHPEIRPQFLSRGRFWLTDIPAALLKDYHRVLNEHLGCDLEWIAFDFDGWSETVFYDSDDPSNDPDVLEKIAALRAETY